MFALDIVFPFSTEFLSELDVVCPSQHSVAFETLHRRAFSDLSTLFIVPHRVPGGGELTAKIFDKNGLEVPLEEYHLDVDGDDFTFNFKRPSRDKSGKYTLVFGYDGKETSADIFVEFLGM